MGPGKCRVELILNVYGEDGELISDIPKGSWYNMDREMANAAAVTLTDGVNGVVKAWNEAAFSNKGNPGSGPK